MVLEIEGRQVSGKRSGKSVPKEAREERQRPEKNDGGQDSLESRGSQVRF